MGTERDPLMIGIGSLWVGSKVEASENPERGGIMDEVPLSGTRFSRKDFPLRPTHGKWQQSCFYDPQGRQR